MKFIQLSLKKLKVQGKLKDILCSWVERPNIIRMLMITSQTHLMQSLSKFQWCFFAETENTILKFMKSPGTTNSQNYPEKQSWSIHTF
jgi:hypothetical protein